MIYICSESIKMAKYLCVWSDNAIVYVLHRIDRKRLAKESIIHYIIYYTIVFIIAHSSAVNDCLEKCINKSNMHIVHSTTKEGMFVYNFFWRPMGVYGLL